jgi:LacI family transcriptional regulator, galactose operon repressor
MVKIADISKASGCSIAAVSRVLSLNPHKDARVAQKTREHIVKVAAELGYRPNRTAEFLKRGGSPNIGVFLPRISTNQISELVFGLSGAALADGFPLSMSFDMSYDSYKVFLDNNTRSRNCGIITYPWFKLDSKALSLIEKYHDNGGRMVLLDVEGNDKIEDLKEKITCISMDNYRGGEIAAECLSAHSCKAYVVLIPRSQRAQGFSAYMEKSGMENIISIDVDKERLQEDEASLNYLFEIVKNEKTSPVGIFATSAAAAITIMTYLLGRGMKVSEDFFLVSYDDLYLSKFTHPSITTIKQPFYEAGKLAVEKLIKLIYEKPVESELLAPELIKRNTA